MNAEIQYLIVATAAFTGAVGNNVVEWLLSKDSNGNPEKFNLRKFIASLIPAFFATGTVASGFNLLPNFVVTAQVIVALMAGFGAMQANNRARG